jgi:hypothetical protein
MEKAAEQSGEWGWRVRRTRHDADTENALEQEPTERTEFFLSFLRSVHKLFICVHLRDLRAKVFSFSVFVWFRGGCKEKKGFRPIFSQLLSQGW